MKHLNMNTDEIETIFTEIGLSSSNGLHYKERLKKHRQIFDFISHIEKAVKRLSTKRTLVLLDCACGRSYLSFVANYYLTNVMGRDVRFIGIDYNEHVIDQSRQAAKKLGFNNMTFICEDIFKVNLDTKPDIVFSLHACNMATDMTIAKGLVEQANYIMTVSCCQHHVRSNMKKHPLGAITRHGVYKERVADMLSDSMRALVLEMYGYQSKIFDYVPESATSKNVMVRAQKGQKIDRKVALAESQYKDLKQLFNIEPKLLEYIDHANTCKKDAAHEVNKSDVIMLKGFTEKRENQYVQSAQ